MNDESHGAGSSHAGRWQIGEMTLDVAILGEDGAPSDSVGVGVDDHWTLLERARPRERFPLLGRLTDYYADASFAPGDVPKLRAELASLDRAGLEDLIDGLIALASQAHAADMGLEAIAD